MKLSQLRHSEPQLLNFINPHTQEQTDISLMVYPLNSYVGNKAKHEAQLSKISKDDSSQIAIEMFAKLVHSWDGVEDENGEPILCTFENVKKCFMDYEELLNAVYKFSDSLGKN